MSTLPEGGERAGSGAGREGKAEERGGVPDARHGVASSGADASADEATVVPESTIDAAVEMTFPASDPPAWMPPGGGHG